MQINNIQQLTTISFSYYLINHYILHEYFLLKEHDITNIQYIKNKIKDTMHK